MKNLSRTLIFFAAAIVMASAGCASGDHSVPYSPNKVPPSIERKADALTHALERDGFQVKRGYWFVFGIPECQYAVQVMGNCYGNNPAAPYIVPALPPWPEEYVEQSYRNAFGLLLPGYNSIYRFDPKEAIIILAQLPPAAAYFGLQTYEFSREGTINTQDPVYKFLVEHGIPQIVQLFFNYTPNPKRIRIFASIGNSNNNVVVERKSGASFGQERFFIITPDQFMERNMRQALLDAGVPDAKDIFVEPVAPPLELGLGEKAYDFMTWIRYAMPAELSAGDQWRKDLPMVILRVRDARANRSPEAYAPVTLETRVAEPEAYLQADFDKLINAVKEYHVQPGATALPIFDIQSLVDLVGPHCNVRGMNCLGDTQDTSYQGTFWVYFENNPLPEIPAETEAAALDNDQVYAVVGTLATKTNNAVYVNLSIYVAQTLTGVESIDSANLANTANRFSDKVDNADKFYVYYFTRDCASKHLTNCTSVTTDKIPIGAGFRVIQRNYIKPSTERGADSTKLLSPKLIKLDGSKM